MIRAPVTEGSRARSDDAAAPWREGESQTQWSPGPDGTCLPQSVPQFLHGLTEDVRLAESKQSVNLDPTQNMDLEKPWSMKPP